jgi:hypothetical protein
MAGPQLSSCPRVQHACTLLTLTPSFFAAIMTEQDENRHKEPNNNADNLIGNLHFFLQVMLRVLPHFRKKNEIYIPLS